MPDDLIGTRILVLMPSIPLHGMERANLQIMKMMRERGAEVTFVTEERYGGVVRAEIERIGGRSVTMVHDRRLRFPRGARELAATLAWMARAAAVFRRVDRDFRPTHVHVPSLGYLLLWLPSLSRAKSRVVFRLPNPPDRRLSGWRRTAADFAWRRLAGRIPDVIVCNSRYTCARLLERGIAADKIRVIYNCVPERSAPAESDAPERDPARLRVAYVGQIRREKGVAELYAAARALVDTRPDVDFWLAGDYRWQNPFAAGLREEVERDGLADRIRFLGYVDDVPRLLANADVHVCPSTSDTDSLPNVILEAKRAGRPSVVFPTAGLPESIRHDVDGWVCESRTAEALVTGIRRYLDHPDMRGSAGRAATDSLSAFSRTTSSDAWAEVYRPGRASG